MNPFDDLLPRLLATLDDDPERPGVFFAQAMAARQQIALAIASGNLPALRSAMAAYGGLVKRWRRWLIEIITESALQGCDTSRIMVRHWQRRVLGQSVASGRLRQYANPERSGAGRSAPFVLLPGIEAAAAAFYERHKDAIKSCMEKDAP